MRKFITILSCVLLVSCFKNYKNTANNTSDAVASDSIHAPKETTNDSDDTIGGNVILIPESIQDTAKNIAYPDNPEFPIDKKLPFGSDILINHVFPDIRFSYVWDSPETNSKGDSIHQYKLCSIVRYYNRIESVYPDDEEFLPILSLRNISYLKLETRDFADVPDLRMMHDIISPHRTENIGPYEVYFYISQRSMYNDCNISLKTLRHPGCKEQGFLIFYKKETGDAIVLKSYFINTEIRPKFRFFYISKDNTIRIYEADSRDSGSYHKTESYVALTHQIEIKDNGNINVTTIDTERLWGDENFEEFSDERKQKAIAFREKYKQRFVRYRDSLSRVTNPLVETYPFGAKELVSHQFPKEAFKAVISENPNKSTDYKVLSSIWHYYFEMNMHSKRASFLPPIKEVKRVEVNGSNQWFDVSLSVANPYNSPRVYFRLPDIANYQVYYLANLDDESKCTLYDDNVTSIASFEGCDINGMILLHDKATQIAYTINAYSISSNKINTSFRFFYIDNNKRIHIYEGYGDHRFLFDSHYHPYPDTVGNYKIEEINTIQILESGEIKVE